MGAGFSGLFSSSGLSGFFGFPISQPNERDERDVGDGLSGLSCLSRLSGWPDRTPHQKGGTKGSDPFVLFHAGKQLVEAADGRLQQNCP